MWHKVPQKATIKSPFVVWQQKFLPWSSNWVWPMFSRAILNLQKLEKVCEAFKIGHGAARFEKMPNCNKQKIFFLFFVSWTTTIFHALNVNKNSFFTCMLVGDKTFSPTTNMGLATMHFLIFECLIKESNFKRKNYPTLYLWTNFTFHHVHHLHKLAQTNKILLPTGLGKPYSIPKFLWFFLWFIGTNFINMGWGDKQHNSLPFLICKRW